MCLYQYSLKWEWSKYTNYRQRLSESIKGKKNARPNYNLSTKTDRSQTSKLTLHKYTHSILNQNLTSFIFPLTLEKQYRGVLIKFR